MTKWNNSKINYTNRPELRFLTEWDDAGRPASFHGGLNGGCCAYTASVVNGVYSDENVAGRVTSIGAFGELSFGPTQSTRVDAVELLWKLRAESMRWKDVVDVVRDAPEMVALGVEDAEPDFHLGCKMRRLAAQLMMQASEA